MSGALDWQREGRHWPHREASRFVEAGGLTWHVQVMGEGSDKPVLLLLHGTAASCHSFHLMMDRLADDYHLIVPDLPGHAFTQGAADGDLTLPNVAESVAGLLNALDAKPSAIIGHSAGAAIALQLNLDGLVSAPVIGLNPALAPFPWPATQTFPAMARLLLLNPLVPRVFAGFARSTGGVKRLIGNATGSHIDLKSMRCYETLIGNGDHCRGTLAMMANWDLETLDRSLPQIETEALLIHSRGDSAIPVDGVKRAAQRLPKAQLEVLPQLGHLAHEEEPGAVIAQMEPFLTNLGVAAR